MKKNNVQFTFYCDKGLKDEFQKRFPRMSSNFFNLCLQKALTDKSFFDSVWFGSVSGSVVSTSSIDDFPSVAESVVESLIF